MALLTSQAISRVAVALLRRQLVLPQTVTRVPGEEFSGSSGDTVTLRVPQPQTARVQATPGAAITYDEINEIPVDVTLSHLYHATHVTDEELTYEIADFARQITAPQTAAVARGAEKELVDVFNALPAEGASVQFPLTPDPDADLAVILAARAFLGAAEAPEDDRFFAVSPQIASRILSIPNLLRASEAGSDSALRRAVIGQIFGFTFLEVGSLTANTAVAYHRSGFAFTNRPPAQPRGATESAVTEDGGIALRHIFQYDPDHLQDASVVSTFAGAAAVWEDGDTATDNKRFVKIDRAAT